MEDYPVPYSPARDTVGMHRLRLVALLECEDSTLSPAEVAATAGLSRQRLHQLKQQAAEALEPKPPGPSPQQRELARLRREVSELRQERDDLLEEHAAMQARMANMVEVNERQRDRLELLCFANNVPLRGTQEIIEVAMGEDWRPGRGSVHRRLRARGQVALDLMSEARAQVAGDLTCVMADDVYFHRRDIKVVAEPESMAMLNVGHWEGSSGLDWVVWLEEYSKLELLCSALRAAPSAPRARIWWGRSPNSAFGSALMPSTSCAGSIGSCWGR